MAVNAEEADTPPLQSPVVMVALAGCVSGLNYSIKIERYARTYNRSISSACPHVLIHSSTGSFHHLCSDLCYDLKKAEMGLGLWLRACYCAHVCLSELDISLKKMLD